MNKSPLVIFTNPACPRWTYSPGIRGWLQKWLRLPLRRPMVVVNMGPRDYMIHPANLPRIKEILIKSATPFEVRPALSSVK